MSTDEGAKFRRARFETVARDRNALTWLVAAAAVLLVAGVGAFVALGSDDGSGRAPTAQEPSVTGLTVAERGAGRCMVPNAALLSDAAIAVDARVVAIESGVVTLEPSRWYAGEPTDEVRVHQSSAGATALVGAVRFEDGGRYLVAGTADGNLMVCGFSGEHTDDLARLYAEAFGS